MTAIAFRGSYVVTQYGNLFSVDWCLGNSVVNIKAGIDSLASAQELAQADYHQEVQRAIL
ncbi:hypothetical protein [Photobacterium aquae]|nr:hypothetical protein [Photobacterium aquae]